MALHLGGVGSAEKEEITLQDNVYKFYLLNIDITVNAQSFMH